MINEIFNLGSPSSYEERYLSRTNRGVFWLLAGHVVLIPILAYAFDTSLFEGLAVFALVMSAPAWAISRSPGARSTSHLLAFAAIATSGILIHLSKGLIEFHFHIFVALAWMIVFGNPWVLLTAAATAAVHHLAFYFLLPSSVFNYSASLGVVFLHAGFVVAETVVNLVVCRSIRKMILAQSIFESSAPRVRGAVVQMVDQLEESAASIEKQSAHLQTTASTITEINQMVAATADNAVEASRVGAEIQRSMTENQAVLQDLKSKFEVLDRRAKDSGVELQESFSQIQELLKFFKEVEGKTQVINDIVFQTKLLSFNASVEAARAGEHGKGFAVVAEEVGNLAQMSGVAAKEINELMSSGVERSQKILQEAIAKAQRSSSAILTEVEGSRTHTDRSLASFDGLLQGIRQAIDYLNRIAQANGEQKLGVENLTQAFSEIARSAAEISSQSLEESEQGRLAERHLTELMETLAQVMEGQARTPGPQMDREPGVEVATAKSGEITTAKVARAA